MIVINYCFLYNIE